LKIEDLQEMFFLILSNADKAYQALKKLFQPVASKAF
jgi:hypothetical protein